MAASPRRDPFDDRAASYTRERVRLYNEANARYPSAREEERRRVIERLSLVPGLTICDISAGGGYLADGIRDAAGGACRIICVENSEQFSESLPDDYEKVLCSLCDLEVATESVDRVACLAGLHHQRDKQRVCDEAYRILVPGGVIAVADVREASPPAAFLNEAVDRWSDLGHDGMFLAPGELARLLARAGFEDVEERHEPYCWSFPDRATLVAYCRSLFRMTGATLAEVTTELTRHLEIHEDDDGAHLAWELTFARARKPLRDGRRCA